MCRWVSIIPGITIPSEASISNVPSGTSSAGPIAAILSSTTSTSAPCRTSWASFMVSTVPLRMTTGRPASISVNVSSSFGLPAPFQADVARSRTEHLLRTARGAALALPRLADARERERRDVEDDVAARHVGGQRPVPLAAHLDRRVGDREAAHVERDRPDRGGREGDLEPGELADLDVAGVEPGGAHGGHRGPAPQRVDREIH